MKKLSLTLLTCLLFLSPNVVLSETMDDLVVRDGLYYKKSSDVPFSGEVAGLSKGTFKNGKVDGIWIGYYDNGQLNYKTTFNKLKMEGASVHYHKNGQLWSKGNFKNGEREGAWVDYNKDGTIVKKLTGTFKNGKKVSNK
jgi:antitoxin component YwqK of YwqJK toxin-antitoxin module